MSRPSDFEISVCAKDDLSQLVSFARQMKRNGAVNFLPQDEQAFVSKYARPDDPEHLDLFLLKDAGKNIIGCTGYVPFKGLLKSKRVDGFIADDAFIDPRARQSLPGLVPLFARSYERLIRHERLLALACPVSRDIAQNFKRAQWNSFAWLYKFHHTAIAGIAPDCSFSVEITKIDAFSDGMNYFFERVGTQHDFLLNSDIPLLNWKYFKKSLSDTIVLLAKKGEVVLGYIALRQKDGDVHIVDITVDLDYPHTMLLLMHEGFTYCQNRSVCITFCYASHRRYIDILQRAGFECSLELECLFFKVGMILYSSIEPGDFHSSDSYSYHFNGFSSP